MKKKSFLLSFLILFALLALVGCKKHPSGETLSKVNPERSSTFHFYAPQYVAIQEGYFAEEGIDLNLVTGFGADKTMTAVLSGEADIGFMGAEATIYAYAEGAKDSVVNFAQLTQRAGNFLVAREEDPDFSWQDLKGKKVLGGLKRRQPERFLSIFLKKNNMDSKDRPFPLTRVSILVLLLPLSPADRVITPSSSNRPPRLRNRKAAAMLLLRSALTQLCSLHSLLCKIQLSERITSDHPGIHQCSAKRYGLCACPHAC